MILLVLVLRFCDFTAKPPDALAEWPHSIFTYKRVRSVSQHNGCDGWERWPWVGASIPRFTSFNTRSESWRKFKPLIHCHTAGRNGTTQIEKPSTKCWTSIPHHRQGHEGQTKTEKPSQTEEPEATWSLNAVSYPGVDSRTEGGSYGDNWWNSNA